MIVYMTLRNPYKLAGKKESKWVNLESKWVNTGPNWVIRGLTQAAEKCKCICVPGASIFRFIFIWPHRRKGPPLCLLT